MASRKPLGVLFFTVALDLIGFGMVVPLMPLYAEAFGASGAAIAWLMASYSLMQFFLAPLWGRLSDRVGRRPVLLVSIAGNAVALLGFALAQSYGQLLCTRLLAGACTANLSVASAYVADSTSVQGRARGMGMIGAAFGLGFVFGPFFAGELSVYHRSLPPAVAAALAACNWLLALRFLPESLSPEVREQAARAPKSRQAWWRERLQPLRVAPHLWPLFALTFLQVTGFAMMEMALVLFTQRRFGFGPSQGGRLLAFVGLVMVVVQGGLIGWLVRRLGEPWLVKLGLLAMAAALFVLPRVGPPATTGLLGALALLAAGQGVVGPGLSALVSRGVPVTAQGTALGLGQSLSALARVVGPALAGPLFDGGGENAPLLAAACALTVATLLAYMTLHPHRFGVAGAAAEGIHVQQH